MNDNDKDFAGKNGFIWWTGVVENRDDPLKMGQCQVRCVGWDADNKMHLPTADLPWAKPLLPVNGTGVYAPKEGDMVIGFFIDGENAQERVMMGILPSIPLKEANPQNPFADPRTTELSTAPRPPKSKKYNTDGTGVTITEEDAAGSYPRILDEPSTSRIARNDTKSITKTFIQERKDNVITGVKTVNGTWNEPKTPYNTVYPYNNVRETESGHILEFDDTYGAERVHLAHRNGSFQEWFPNGDKVEKVTKDNYQIIMGDDKVYIMGKCQVTVQGDAEVYVKGKVDMKVDSSVTATALSFTLNGPTTVNGTLHATGGISGDNGSVITGSISATGDVTAGSISLQGHTHPDPQGGNTSSPT
jgi:hypothetical protein